MVELEILAFGTHMTSASARLPLNRFDTEDVDIGADYNLVDYTLVLILVLVILWCSHE